jgi:hypothetical protein
MANKEIKFTFFDIKCSQDIQKYIDAILETKEFNEEYAIFQTEIKKSIEDDVITTIEIKNIAAKMFKVLATLQNIKLKYNNKKMDKLKDILKDNMTEILTILILQSLNDVLNKHPSLNMVITKEEIEYIVTIIVETAEFSIDTKIKKGCLNIFG